MVNLGSSNTPVEGESFGLPAGAELTEDANGNLAIADSSGSIVLTRDETAGEWQFENTDLTGINTIDVGSAKVGSVDADRATITDKFDAYPGSGYIYLLGGAPGGGTGTWYIYDIQKDMWVERTDYSGWTYGTNPVGVYNGELYGWAFGGNTVADSAKYDPRTNSWTSITNIPTAKNKLGHKVELLNGGFYLCGGQTDSGRSTTVHFYDPAADTYTQKNDLPAQHSFPHHMEWNGYLYLITGNSNTTGVSPGHIQRMDLSTETWEGPSNFTNHPYEITDGMGVQVGDKGLFFGGWSPTNATPAVRDRSKAVHEYDFATDTWTHVTDMPQEWTHGGCVYDGTYVYLFGGTYGTGGGGKNEAYTTEQIMRYHVDNQEFTYADPMPTKRYNFGMVHTDVRPPGL